MKQVFKKYLWLIGIVLFVYVLAKVDLLEIFSIFKKADLRFLLVSFLFILPFLVIQALRWKIFIELLGIKLGFWPLFKMLNQSIFWGMITPAKLGGFVGAKYLAAHSRANLTEGIWTVLSNRILDLLDTLLLGSVAVLFLSYIFGRKVSLTVILVLLVIFILTFAFYLIVKKGKGKRLFKLAFAVLTPNSLREKVGVFFGDLFDMTKLINFLSIAKSWLYELMLLVIVGVAQFFIALALDIEVPLWYLLLIIPLLDIVSIMPISVLGIGTREVSYVFLFSLLGININQAVAFSLLVMFWIILHSLPGFLLFLLNQRQK